MGYVPLNYSQVNWLEGLYSPSNVKNLNNVIFSFWERNLFMRLTSIIKFDLPDNWQGSISDFFYYWLFRRGFLCISKNDEYGYFFQPCNVRGYNFYYQPTNALIANPKMSADLLIGRDCELLKLTPDYMGVWDLITYYAEKLAILDSAINMNAINSKLAYVVYGRNRAAVESLKVMMDKINHGEPAVFLDKKLNKDRVDEEDPLVVNVIQDVKNNYILGDLLRDFQTILNDFDEEIGIPTIPYQKKERMTQYESESRITSSSAKIQVWKKALDASLEAINALYSDLNITYKITFEEVLENATGKNNTPGDS